MSYGARPWKKLLAGRRSRWASFLLALSCARHTLAANGSWPVQETWSRKHRPKYLREYDEAVLSAKPPHSLPILPHTQYFRSFPFSGTAIALLSLLAWFSRNAGFPHVLGLLRWQGDIGMALNRYSSLLWLWGSQSGAHLDHQFNSW